MKEQNLQQIPSQTAFNTITNSISPSVTKNNANRLLGVWIFFGGMVKAGELIMKPIREAYEAHVLKIFKGKAQFLVSGLDGASAAVLGASAIGWEIQ